MFTTLGCTTYAVWGQELCDYVEGRVDQRDIFVCIFVGMKAIRRKRVRPIYKNGGKTGGPKKFEGTAEEYEDLPDEYRTMMLPTAEVETGFVPQDIPEGYDPYENNSMEQKIFDNLGMEGVLEYRKMREGIHESTEPFGKVATEVLSLIEGGPVATRGIPALRRMFMRKAGKFVDDIPANQL